MKIFLLLLILLAITYNSIHSQVTGNSLYDNAYRNYKSGNFEKAITYYSDFLKSYSNNDKAFFERGMCFESLRRFDEAKSDYSIAIQLKPFFSPYYISRGYVFVKTGFPQNANDDFTKAIQNDPANSDGYVGRVNAYLDLGKYDLALSDINYAITLTPNNPLLYYYRAMIYTDINDTTKFYNDLEKILDNYPSEFFTNYKSQGVVLILDNIEQNVDFLTKQIADNPEDNLLYFKRGFNYYLLRKFVPASEDFSNSIKFSTEPSSRLVILSSKLIKNSTSLIEK